MTGVSTSGVSVSAPAPASSAFDQDMQIAYAGGGDFMARLQRLAEAKDKADSTLAALDRKSVV